ncbi:MAG: hypothetical protein ACPHP9_15040, partial [bacterium]
YVSRQMSFLVKPEHSHGVPGGGLAVTPLLYGLQGCTDRFYVTQVKSFWVRSFVGFCLDQFALRSFYFSNQKFCFLAPSW